MHFWPCISQCMAKDVNGCINLLLEAIFSRERVKVKHGQIICMHLGRCWNTSSTSAFRGTSWLTSDVTRTLDSHEQMSCSAHSYTVATSPTPYQESLYFLQFLWSSSKVRYFYIRTRMCKLYTSAIIKRRNARENAGIQAIKKLLRYSEERDRQGLVPGATCKQISANVDVDSAACMCSINCQITTTLLLHHPHCTRNLITSCNFHVPQA